MPSSPSWLPWSCGLNFSWDPIFANFTVISRIFIDLQKWNPVETNSRQKKIRNNLLLLYIHCWISIKLVAKSVTKTTMWLPFLLLSNIIQEVPVVMSAIQIHENLFPRNSKNLKSAKLNSLENFMPHGRWMLTSAAVRKCRQIHICHIYCLLKNYVKAIQWTRWRIMIDRPLWYYRVETDRMRDNASYKGPKSWTYGVQVFIYDSHLNICNECILELENQDFLLVKSAL